jgi:hypothetical protein
VQFLSLAGSAYAIWMLELDRSTPPSRHRQKKKNVFLKLATLVAVISLLWALSSHLSSPVLPHPLKETYKHPMVPLQILSSVQSATGVIVVSQSLSPLEDVDARVHSQGIDSARFLRASHSILGGVWLGKNVATIGAEPPVVDSFGTQLGDSIYSTFVLQEAVRLVNSTERGKGGSLKNGLIM